MSMNPLSKYLTANTKPLKSKVFERVSKSLSKLVRRVGKRVHRRPWRTYRKSPEQDPKSHFALTELRRAARGNEYPNG
eukprot:6178793-Pleurochrysis_carterae.AAC.4